MKPYAPSAAQRAPALSRPKEARRPIRGRSRPHRPVHPDPGEDANTPARRQAAATLDLRESPRPHAGSAPAWKKGEQDPADGVEVFSRCSRRAFLIPHCGEALFRPPGSQGRRGPRPRRNACLDSTVQFCNVSVAPERLSHVVPKALLETGFCGRARCFLRVGGLLRSRCPRVFPGAVPGVEGRKGGGSANGQGHHHCDNSPVVDLSRS
jgi:hypothetical protein